MSSSCQQQAGQEIKKLVPSSVACHSWREEGKHGNKKESEGHLIRDLGSPVTTEARRAAVLWLYKTLPSRQMLPVL